MDLAEAREKIRETDEKMAALFAERMEAARAIAAWKRERGLPVEDPAQEARVLAGRSALVADPEIREYYVNFLQYTIGLSRRWQHRLMEGRRVAYCGVEGAFAQIAARRIFPDGVVVACPAFEAAYAAVERGDCDAAVLPIENSYGGEVGQSLDLMFSGGLFVNGVYDLRISQNLLALPGTQLEDVKTVVSHPQALDQCREYLLSRGFALRAASNTAAAARAVAAEGDKSVAAIPSRETAELYGLAVLAGDINDSPENTTRFAVFSRAERPAAGAGENGAFLLLFTVSDRAGALAMALNVISAHGFNLRVLRSRPMKDLPWHYYFYAEAEGDDTSENGRRMLEALRAICPRVRVAGRYTTGADALRGGEPI